MGWREGLEFCIIYTHFPVVDDDARGEPRVITVIEEEYESP